MWKYAVQLSYLGTDFCGWQKQKRPEPAPQPPQGRPAQPQRKEAPSIQATLEACLLRITGETVSCVGSGRTDSGVHALGQVVHFVLKKKAWDSSILQKGLNSLLPRSIQVLGVKEVPLEFHAQRSALKKQYSYYFQQGPCALPYLEPLSWWIRKELDIEAMNQAIRHLIGEHDFKPFQASGSKPGPTVRQILEAEVSVMPIGFPGTGLDGVHLVRVRVLGTGFLKQMVRGIAGTLLQIGEKRRPSSCMKDILESLDRNQVGPTAPARALWLERVWYD